MRFGARELATMVALAPLAAPMAVQAQARPDQKAFFTLYKELVETNTVVGQGSCTRAAQQIATRMKAAGYPDLGDNTDAWDEWAGPWDYEPENNDPEAMARLCEIDPALRMNPGNVRGFRVPKEG